MSTKSSERQKRVRDFYSESIQARKMTWPDSYWCCRGDIEYINKYERRFKNRHKFKGVLHFSILAAATILLVVMVAFFCCGFDMSFGQLLIAIAVSLILVLIELGLRIFYFNRMELNLIRASNRICILSEIWPEIVDIVESNMEKDSVDIPPEPRKTFGHERCTDQPSDLDFSTIFFDENNDSDIIDEKTFDNLFTTPTEEELSLAEEIEKAIRPAKPAMVENPIEITVEEESEKPIEEPTPEESATKEVLEESTEEPEMESEGELAEAEIFRKILAELDALNKRLQEGS